MNDPTPNDVDLGLGSPVWVSAAISSIFVAIQLLLIFSVAPGFIDMYGSLGSDLPLVTRLLVALGEFGIAGILLLIDVGAFFVMYRLARKYGVGLVLIPIAVHAGLAMLIPLILYLPMFRIFDLIR